MLNRPSKAAIIPAVLAIGALMAALLLLLFVQNQALAQEGGVIRYTENDTDPVRVFTSTDPEGADIDWDVTGTDADDFKITRDSNGNGVLRFREPPNYERPSDRGLDLNDDNSFNAEGEFEPTDNEYQITVRATEERAGGATGRALSTESHITVQVDNLNEPGVVQMNRLQPEVGTEITASLTDPDVVVDSPAPIWAWFTSKVDDPDPNVPSDWNQVAGETAMAYTPDGDRADSVTGVDDNNVAVDEGKYLRTMVTYTDGQGADKTAVLKSAYPVRAEVFSDNDPGQGNRANGSPGFNLETDKIAIPENTPVEGHVGGPAVATDPNGDRLTYELDSDNDTTTAVDATGDVGFFKVDQRSGQITVAKELDFESRPPNGEYMIIIRATDPSGEFDDQTVTITAEDVNDAPEIMNGLAELRVDEQDADDNIYTGGPDMAPRAVDEELLPNTYMGSDQDKFGSVTWSLEGKDADLFLLSADGVPGESRDLKFKSPPNYESPADANWDNVYKVIVVATDDNQGVDKRPVSVIVENVHEKGKLTLSTQQPLIGEEITARVTDPDEGVAIITWQWYRGEIQTDQTVDYTSITGATSHTYTPEGDAMEDVDQGRYLRVTATYVDTTSEEDDPSTPQSDERVQETTPTFAPKTPDATDGAADGSDRLYLVMATSEFTVKVKAGDTVTDSTPAVPAFPVGPVTREVAENARIGDYVGAPVTADGDGNEYTLDSGNNDHLSFEIDVTYGQISVAGIGSPLARPDLDYEVKSTYNVKVTATNTQGAAATAEVTIELVNLNETPYFDQDSLEPLLTIERTKTHAENSPGAVANYRVIEPDNQQNDVHWYVIGLDSADFTIEDGVLKFNTPPDFENPTDRDGEDGIVGDDNEYEIVVRATEKTAVGGGPLKSKDIPVTVTVTNEDENGMADLSLLQPEVNTEIMVTLTDPDDQRDLNTDDLSGHQYTWYKSKVVNPDPKPDPADLDDQWEEVRASSPNDAYTPRADDPNTADENESDVGKYLLAKVDYRDITSVSGVEGNRVAIAISAHRVQADVTDEDNNSPDFADADDQRTVLENIVVGAHVGAPVTVPSNEDNDRLTYEFVTSTDQTNGNPEAVAGDLEYFAIDKGTAQITVTQALSFEDNDGRVYTGNDPPTAGEYTVVVRATDPSGETTNNENRDDITVTINVGDVNEAPRVSAGDGEIELAENRALAFDETEQDDSNLYQWADEDKDDAPRWQLEGVDRALFQFSTAGDGRRLHFREAPDYENPSDQGGDNVYNVTVVVIDNDELKGMKLVRIEVTNVNEAGEGMGMLSVSPQQPHLGEPVVAVLIDPDGIMTDPDGEQTITTWQWYKTSTDMPLPDENADGVLDLGVAPEVASVIGGATTNAYTPGGDDVGNFLHVRVTYRDGHNDEDDPTTEDDESVDDGDRVLLVRTENAVQQDTPGTDDGIAQNVAPVINPSARTVSVPENTPSTGYVGELVVAMDDGMDPLVYDLSGTDSNRFALADKHMEFYGQTTQGDPALDPGLGQIVLRPVTHLDHESGKVYEFEIGATDSQGERSTGTITVNVTDVNEAPSEPVEFFGGFAISGLHEVIYDENDTINVAIYEGMRPPIGTQVSWNKSGDDADDFMITRDSDGMGVLRFKKSPNYEEPTDEDTDNVYEISVDATAGLAEYSIPVTITVINGEEPGTVTLTTDAPRVGVEVTARLEDPDGPERVVWEWSRSTQTPGIWNVIASSASDTYLPTEAIVGWELRATARYDDGHSSGKTAKKATTQPVITAPTFPDGEDGMRSVDENSAEGTDVGDPVTANYADSYALSGTDATSFSIDEATGQIKVGTGTVLDFETKGSYMVTVTATDSAGVSEDLMVTISINNVNEPGSVSLSPEMPRAEKAITATLVDPDKVVAGRVTWRWESSAASSGPWTPIDGATAASYMVAKADSGMFLRAMASYTDGSGPDEAVSDATAYAVAPAFPDGEDGMRSVDENSAEGTDVGNPVTASNADRYALSGAYAASFSIDAATGQIKVGTGTVLDFETERSYMVTVIATDAAGSSEELMVTININNVDEPGSVTLSMDRPRAGAEIMATLADPDNVVDGRVAWRWESSADGADPWTPIDGATDASYMVAKADSGMFLRARASYTDEHGGGKTKESGATTYAVAPAFPASEDGMRSVDENSAEGTDVGDPVTASNADSYALSGTDAASFTINEATGQIMVGAGVLDYEMMDSYMVTVTATDAAGSSEDLMVTININNVEELGSVSLSTDRPRAGEAITATPEDPDNVVDTSVAWWWESSANGADPWTPIGASDASYMVAKADSGMFLRARASYTDGHGGGKTAESPATAYAVAPAFPDSEDGMRSVDENSAEGTDVGDPVTASNAFSYALSGTDVASFSINEATGQIMVGTGAVLDFETEDIYMVTVIATDAAGSSEDLMVTININNVNEPGSVSLSTEMPRAGAEIMATLQDPDNVVDGSATWRWESSAASSGPWTPIDGATDASYMVAKADSGMFLRAMASYTDGSGSDEAESPATTYAVAPAFPDSEDGMRSVDENSVEGTDVGNPVTASNADSYALSGTEAAFFSINEATGQIMVGTGTMLDFETEDIYMVIVTATDSAGVSEELMVTININNVEEPGSVTLSTDTPRPGAEIMATLADPDNVVDGSAKWQWESGDGQGAWTAIDGATDATYMVVETDRGNYLRAMSMYTDGFGPDEAVSDATANAVAGNAAPVFDAETAERMVAENTAAGADIGAPVAATDADTGDALTYTLGGTDMASFTIDADTGQLKTSEALDFENRTTYEVEVTATDGSGATAMITVTITVTDRAIEGAASDYDADNDGTIDSGEVLAAVGAYFDGDLSPEEVLAVVALYFQAS